MPTDAVPVSLGRDNGMLFAASDAAGKSLLQRILCSTVTKALGVGFVGLCGYIVYRAYQFKRQQEQNRLNDKDDSIDIQQITAQLENAIITSKRSSDDIDQVYTILPYYGRFQVQNEIHHLTFPSIDF